MFSKKFTALTSVFLIFAIVVGGMLGFYDARLEAAVTPKKLSIDKFKIKIKEYLTFDKDVVNILLVVSDNGAQGSEDGDHGRSDSMMVATINFKTKELKLTSFLRDMYVEIPGHGRNKLNAAYAFGGEILKIYTTDPEVIGCGMEILALTTVTYFLCGVMDLFPGALRGM